MTAFPDFYGNRVAAASLANMIREDRIAQTILLAGPEGIGKATLARRFAAQLLGDGGKIEQDDLSLPENQERIAEREKLSSEKRAEDPLLFASHPDFLTFPPEGPLRQLSIQQMRRLKELASYGPQKGKYRVFLIDHIDRANEQAANSLLKILEEPPPHLILILTAENSFDLLPTIRSRAVIFEMTPLNESEMRQFAASRGWAANDRRLALAAGRPGLAVTMDPQLWEMRRQRMLALLAVAAAQASFASWIKHSEAIAAGKAEKLEDYLKILYLLLEDVLLVHAGGRAARNPGHEDPIARIASKASLEWIEAAIRQVDELVEFAKRNVQKSLALDALAVELRRRAG